MARTHTASHPVGFWKGSGIPTTRKRPARFILCGCCGHFHRVDFYGDCREDAERFRDIPKGGVEVFEDGGEDL